jgi:hypothetical protein
LSTQAYRAIGVSLPRRSAEQATVGSKVDKSDLKPGDLVFFRTGRSRRINHVGVYVGSGKFVHASSSKREVREDSLSEGYYQSRYATARRVKGGTAPEKKPTKNDTEAYAQKVKDADKQTEKAAERTSDCPNPATGGI